MDLFTKEYVQNILTPFIGKELRMRTESEDKSSSIPFCLETSIESSFQIELNNMGIKFLLKNNFYIKRDIDKIFNDSLREIEIYPFMFDKLLKEEPPKGEDCVVVKKIQEYIQKNFNPQIAFTYYTMIKSLKVNNYGFILNGIPFIIIN